MKVKLDVATILMKVLLFIDFPVLGGESLLVAFELSSSNVDCHIFIRILF